MKKLVGIGLALLALNSCQTKDYSGTYTGFAWKGEAKGVTLEEAGEKIETTLVLNASGVIEDARLDFWVKDKDGNWYKRNDPTSTVSVDFNKLPTQATLQTEGQEYKAGVSQFTIKTQDKMSFYAAAVSQEGVTALLVVEPVTRFQFEYRFSQGFDYSTPLQNLTIGSGLMVPTVRASSAALIKPTNWEEYKDAHLFSFYRDPYVLTGRGALKGITPASTAQELLEKVGVVFANGKPQPLAPVYGFTSVGGWSGNYQAVGAFLKGKDALKFTSLVDWSNPRYSKSINAEGFFGVDVAAGATTTVQNSVDGIAGATVRASRESGSYQRALVAAGILEEKDVVKGRF